MRKTTSFLVGLLLLAGCSGSSGDKAVVAKAGSVKITAGDFKKELASAPPVYARYLSTVEGKKEFVEMLLKEKMLLAEAKNSGIASREDVKKQLKQFREDVERQEKQFRENLLVREYLRDLQDKQIKVSDEDLKQYYAQNEETYKNPVKVEASHILTSTEQEAADALARIKKGEKFEKVAQEVSKDPSARAGGLIGEIQSGFLPDVPEFEKALFALKTGGVSDVVKTRLGYHIIKRGSSTKLNPKSFEDAASEIRRILEKQKFDAWVDALKKKNNYTVDETALAQVNLPQPEQSPSSEGENNSAVVQGTN